MRSWLASITIALVVCTASAPVAFAGGSDGVCPAKPFVVKIHADWCATCRKVDAVWIRLGSEMADQVTIVEFDVSDRVAYEQSRDAAARLGLDEFFSQYRSRTGTIAVLDCKSRQPVAVMSGEVDLSKYLDAISKASRPS
jgi:thiol-disulfide isomerase/thioredoxin